MGASYKRITAEFRWDIPSACNIAAETCLRQDPRRDALICPLPSGAPEIWRFGDFARDSARLANALAGLGMRRGERIAVMTGQIPETAVAHLGAWRSGMVSVPLFSLFGPEALLFRLADSGARAVVADKGGLARLAETDLSATAVSCIIATDAARDGMLGRTRVLSWRKLLGAAHMDHAVAGTVADSPALIIYTSGTTGPPKGALLPHRALRGHLPGVRLPHNMFPQKGDCFWTPADWAWIGGLLDVLMPAWFFGIPVVAHRARKFDPEEALWLMAEHGVRNVFMPPTALKMMRAGAKRAPKRLSLRSVGSGGETLGADMLAWGREFFRLDINEFYGQTECNLVVGNCARLAKPRPGSMGRAIPGHRVSVIGQEGEESPPGEEGEIAVHRGGSDGGGDPVMFLRYWKNPRATRKKFRGDWLLTGDRGRRDRDGFFYFVGRDDDVISSAGYRIGPGEVEDCLLSHPSVAMAGVVGVPDALRGQAIKAFIVPHETPSSALAEEIRAHVRERLAAHEYPRHIEFVKSLPMTATGKVRRAALRARDSISNKAIF